MHLGRKESLWVIVKMLRYIEFIWLVKKKLSHDVTFDKDMALRKINHLHILRKDKEDDTRNQGAKEDETMPIVDEPMDPIDPPPHEPSFKRIPS